MSARPWEGTFYQSLVPDTLDLAERARLALDGTVGIMDPEYDYEIYWVAEFNRIPPVLIHNTLGPIIFDGENYKLMEATPLLRLMTGSRMSLEMDQRWRERTLHQIGPDGLAYWPQQGRPWVSMDVPVGGWAPAFGDLSQDQITSVEMVGRLISAMALFGLQDGEPLWRDRIERMISRIAELTVDKGEYAYLPGAGIAPGAKVSPDTPMPSGTWASQPGWLVHGLAHYYGLTRYEPARQLAEKIARYIMGPAGVPFQKMNRSAETKRSIVFIGA